MFLAPLKEISPQYINRTVPKENYILCPSCEEYFSQIEGQFSNKIFRRFGDVRFASQFTESTTAIDLTKKTIDQVSPIFVHLFIISIIWRASVSSLTEFKDFILGDQDSEQLRLVLLNFKATNGTDYKNRVLVNYPMPSIEYVLLSKTDSFDNTHNVFVINFHDNPTLFLLNEFILLFSFKNNKRQETFKEVNNNTNDNNNPAIIAVAKIDAWKYYVSIAMELFSNLVKANLTKDNKVPYTKPARSVK